MKMHDGEVDIDARPVEQLVAGPRSWQACRSLRSRQRDGHRHLPLGDRPVQTAPAQADPINEARLTILEELPLAGFSTTLAVTARSPSAFGVSMPLSLSLRHRAGAACPAVPVLLGKAA